jgi:fluoride ion exporter CrcB/FEX
MGYGHGFPLYNYYPPMPYLIGEIFRLILLPFNDVVKLTFAFGIIASGFAMYLLSSEFFGKKGGILSAVFYVWAPYRAVDVYIRGAMNESWAWIWFPIILWGAYKLISGEKTMVKRYLLITSLSTTGLLLTHNLMVLIFAPVFAVWSIFWLLYSKNFISGIKRLIFAGLIALGLSAFFTIPAVFEQKYVHIDTLTSDYFQYAGHFTTLNQLFISRFWGDGPSIFGPYDQLAFPIGQVHWATISVISIFLLLKFLKTKKIVKLDWIIIFGILIGTGAAFMSHERSGFIWAQIPTLKFVQFPWRFLTINVFGYSFAIGGLFYILDNVWGKKKQEIGIVLGFIATLTVIVLNWNYFIPVHSGKITDEMKFSGEAWRIQQQAGIRDYLPKTAKDDPTEARKQLAEIVKGSGMVGGESYGTNWAKFEVTANEDSTIRINIFNYPIWKVYVNGTEKDIFIAEDEMWGRIYINVPTGKNVIYAKLNNTPLRTAANIISLVTWLGLIGVLIWRKKQKIS